MDAARTAKRLGAEEALIVYRRDRAHMAARDFEADEAVEEGVKIRWLTTIKEIIGPNLTVEMMELDASGPPSLRVDSKRSKPMRLYWRLARRRTVAFFDRCPESSLRKMEW